MYGKIEFERLLFICLNQKSFRYEEYIHLQDTIANDGNITDIKKKNSASIDHLIFLDI